MQYNYYTLAPLHKDQSMSRVVYNLVHEVVFIQVLYTVCNEVPSHANLILRTMSSQ